MTDRYIEQKIAPIQIGRPVANITALCGYARALGVVIEDPEDLHVTQIWSRKAVDWSLPVFQPRSFPMIVTPNKVTLDTLQDLVVLRLNAPGLSARYDKLRAAGASSDWDCFIAHITLGKMPDGGLAGSPAFKDVITFGHEFRKPAKIEKSRRVEEA